MIDMPIANRPSTAMITVVPANSTARPDGVDRRDHRLLGVHSVVQALAVAGDDEQRVVDADADPDHRHGLAREARHRR